VLQFTKDMNAFFDLCVDLRVEVEVHQKLFILISTNCRLLLTFSLLINLLISIVVINLSHISLLWYVIIGDTISIMYTLSVACLISLSRRPKV
jgi:hypothetical protein